jgi:hypothetical protein
VELLYKYNINIYINIEKYLPINLIIKNDEISIKIKETLQIPILNTSSITILTKIQRRKGHLWANPSPCWSPLGCPNPTLTPKLQNWNRRRQDAVRPDKSVRSDKTSNGKSEHRVWAGQWNLLSNSRSSIRNISEWRLQAGVPFGSVVDWIRYTVEYEC